MKAPQIALILALLHAPFVAVAQPTRQDVDSKVSEVTVYSDRARVTREAQVTLTGNATPFLFSALPGWIDEGSVRVALRPADSGQILGVDVERTYLASSSDDDFRTAVTAVREIEDRIAELDDEKAVLEAEAKHIDSVRRFSLDKLPRDAALRRVETAEYTDSVSFVAESLRRVAKAQRQLARQRRDLEPELEARQRRLRDLEQRAQLEQRSVVVRATGNGSATLTVTYMIPGATWEPAHELRTDSSAADVALASVAIVQQTTGEDWTEAQISLATQRSDETLRIPEIGALRLGGGRSLSRWVASSRDSFGAATASYNLHNQAVFNTKHPDAGQQRIYLENQATQIANASRVAELFASLQKRGTTAHFAALGEQTVRSDGSRVRVPIGNMRLEATQRTVAAPELSLNAVRTLDLSNQGTQPLLPGKVGLFVDGAFLGFTELDFVATGEEFELFLGVADHLKLERSLDKRASDLSRRGSRTKLSVAFELRVENLSDREELVELHDRIPVSQSDQIRVTGIELAPETRPDSKGLLHWTLRLAAGTERTIRVAYTVEYPTDLPTASNRSEEELRRQLQSLESLVAN